MREQNVIQAPELVRRLAVRLGLRQAHIAPTLNDGLQPVIIVDDLRSQTAKDQLRAVGMVTTGAPTASFSASVFLRNNSTNGVLARITRLRLWAAVDGVLSAGILAEPSIPAVTGTGSIAWRDASRIIAPAKPVPQVKIQFKSDDVGIPAGVRTVYGFVNGVKDYELDWLLYPGSCLYLVGAQDGPSYTASFEWTEEAEN